MYKLSLFKNLKLNNMSRFEKGDTVYTGRGDKMQMLVVERVIDNPMLPVFQYSFEAPHNGWACGEQSLRETPDGVDLKMRDCYKEHYENDNDTRINTIASALRQVVSEESNGLLAGEVIPKLSIMDSVRVDFMPSLQMTKWIAKYANGRLIIHVGSGQGHLVNMLKMYNSGTRAIGIEPNINKQEWIKWRLHRDDMESIDINEILDGRIEDYGKLLTDLGKDKAMLIVARPKTYKFLEPMWDLMPDGMELLYIVNEEQLIAQPCTLLEHEGVSEDDDRVYSYIKNIHSLK